MNIYAVPQKPYKVIFDFFRQLWTRKILTLVCFFLFSLIATIMIRFYGLIKCCILKEIINANIAVLGIDIAALAILFAVLLDKQLEGDAKQAFDEQSITLLGNALFQLLAILLLIANAVFSSSYLFWMSFCFQFFALIHVFDIIIEMFTLTSLIRNK